MSEQPEVMEELACDDARATRKGSYSAWLKKAKSDNARFKMLQSSNTRYFTIDFEAQLLYYSNSATQKKISQPIPFQDILGAERLLLPPAKKKANKGQCGFSVKTRERTFELFANTPADAAHWTSGLNAARDIGKGSQTSEALPDIQEQCEPTHLAPENAGCRSSGFEMLPNSVAPEDEDSDAADGNDEKEEKQKLKTDQEPAKEPEDEERSRQAESQEAIETERKAKQEAEMRLQELEAVLKAQEAEEADRKAREEAELCREQEERRLRAEKAQREAREGIHQQRQEEAMAREKEELERRQQRDEAQQAQLELARRAQEEATSREAEEARKKAVEKSLRDEDARRQEAERHTLEVQEQQKTQENDRADNDYSNEFSKTHGRMDTADDCKAETETVATAFPSCELSRETELDLLKADVRDLMFEGLGFLEEALDFVFSMQPIGEDDAADAGAEALMKLLTEEIEQKPSLYEPAKSKNKKSDKKTEKTDEEREARKARKEEKRKTREEQKAKEEPRTAEDDQRSAEGAEETAHAIQKNGLPALQPLKPLKQLPKLSARQGMATTSQAGSARSTAIEPAPMPPCSVSEASSVPVSARSTAVEPAGSWEAKAVAEPSGWDSEEDKVLQTRNASSQKPKAEVPEGPIACSNAQDVEPSGWDSDGEKNLPGRGSRPPSERNLKGPAQKEEEMLSGCDSEDETEAEAKLPQGRVQSEQRVQAS